MIINTRPPYRNVDEVNKFLNTLDDHLQKLIKNETYVIGDFNFDLLSKANIPKLNLLKHDED